MFQKKMRAAFLALISAVLILSGCAGDGGNQNRSQASVPSVTMQPSEILDEGTENKIPEDGLKEVFHNEAETASPVVIDETIGETETSAPPETPEAPAATKTPVASAATKVPDTSKKEAMVVITRTGKKYHTAACKYVVGKNDTTALPVSEAKARGYSPCKVCH